MAAADRMAPPMAADSERKIKFYRNPMGLPDTSPTPKKDWMGMDYIAVFEDDGMALPMAADSERKIKFYRNPMGLPDTSPVPKKDSMGMDYIAVYDGEDSDDGSIKLSPGKVQRAGVESVAVAKRPMTRAIKAPGVVQLDERRISVIAPRFDGFVESVGTATTATHVKKGDLLATVFGQEVLNEGARVLVEQAAKARGGDDRTPAGLKSQSGGLIGASRRLLNLGVPEEFIEKIRRERRVPDTIAVRAPRDGVVLERNIVDGQAFKAGDVAFRIADHSQVWMMADVAEGEIAALKTGQTVTVTTRAHPGRVFGGTVAVVFPHLMKETRTARVRIEMPNPDLALLPDMYGEVEIATGAGEAVVTVPSGAVIDSGNRQVVLLDLGDGRFEPRDVKLGRRGDGFTEILSGVAEGDKVVVNGNFLIDAESNLQSALKSFAAPPAMETAP